MPARKILFGRASRERVERGVEIVAKAVRTTLGPAGRNVAHIGSVGDTRTTRDGVTVVRALDEVADAVANLGVQMVREAADQAAEFAGDGTSTTTVLTHALVTAANRLVAAGLDPVQLKRGIDLAAAETVALLERTAVPVDDDAALRAIAMRSANHDAVVGDLVAEAYRKVGRDGIISVERWQRPESVVEASIGAEYDVGWLSPRFITDDALQECVLEDAYVLVSLDEISDFHDLVPVLEFVTRSDVPILVISPDTTGTAVQGLALNSASNSRARGTLRACAIKSPGYGDMRTALVEDIALMTGAVLIGQSVGVSVNSIAPEHLGRARRVVVGRARTLISGGHGTGEPLQRRIRQLQRFIEESDSSFDREHFGRRLARLSSGIATIKVGGTSELEMRERFERVDDALHAARSALDTGLVVGGGAALLHAATALRAQPPAAAQSNEALAAGWRLALDALAAPLIWIARNAGHDGAYIAATVARAGADAVFNAATGQVEPAAELRDPCRVVTVAVQKAASVAGTLITADCAIVFSDRADVERLRSKRKRD